MALSAEQRRIARTIISVGREMGASPKVLKAAIEAGLVESSLRNLRTAVDHDSLGVFQQRPSQGWGSPSQVTNIRYAAKQFFKRAIPLRKKYGKAGDLAQAVQRSAYPGRYHQHAGEAASIVRSLGGSSSGGGGGGLKGATGGGSLPTDVPGLGGQTALPASIMALMQPQNVEPPKPARLGSGVTISLPDTPGMAGRDVEFSPPASLTPERQETPDISSLIDALQGQADATDPDDTPEATGGAQPLAAKDFRSLGVGKKLHWYKQTAGPNKGEAFYIRESKGKLYKVFTGPKGTSRGGKAVPYKGPKRGIVWWSADDQPAQKPEESTNAADFATGKILYPANFNRPGVRTKGKPVEAFAQRLAGRVGTIQPWPNKGHSRLTTSKNVSDHWAGNAMDIPASGQRLAKLGYHALRTAGWSHAKAAAAARSGGLFNVTWRGKRVQIIFKTNQGGNHYDHLHIGVA